MHVLEGAAVGVKPDQQVVAGDAALGEEPVRLALIVGGQMQPEPLVGRREGHPDAPADGADEIEVFLQVVAVTRLPHRDVVQEPQVAPGVMLIAVAGAPAVSHQGIHQVVFAPVGGKRKDAQVEPFAPQVPDVTEAFPLAGSEEVEPPHLVEVGVRLQDVGRAPEHGDGRDVGVGERLTQRRQGRCEQHPFGRPVVPLV